jgi:two-component sensor histidine kinase
VYSQQGHKEIISEVKKKEITEQDYLEALKFFDATEDQPSKSLESAMMTAQKYLMSTHDNDGLINLFAKAAEYAKRTDQTNEFVDLKSSQAQMLISNGRSEEGIVIIDSLIENQTVRINLLTRFHKAKGDAYYSLEDLEQSEKCYFKGLALALEEQDTFNIGIIYISLASLHSNLGNVYDAIDYNLRGLNILEKGDQPYLVAGACNVLCSIFQSLGNYDKAQEYAEKMDELCKVHGYKQFGAFANAALGRQATQYGDYDKAIEYYTLAINEYDRLGVRLHGSNDKIASFNVKRDIVQIYLKQNNYTLAADLLNKMEKEDIEDFPIETKINYYQVQIEYAIAKKNAFKIIDYLAKSQAIISDNSSFKVKKTYAWLNKLASEYSGDYRTANIHLKSYYALKDSIEKKQETQLIHNLEAKYQKAEQEKEISNLSFENHKVESQLKQKNIFLIIGSIGLAILSFLVFQFYKLYQSNKLIKEQLAIQNETITKALADKNTLLKEIHHRVKNNLQVISSLLSLQSRYIKDEETLDAIKAGKSRVQSMSLLHQNLYRDDNLKGVEMNQYFENLGQNLFDTYNIADNIQFTTEIDNMTLDIDTVVPMGLITNELISNALKHAFKGKESGKIHLSLKEINDTLHLTVKDDGVGLPDGELPVSQKSLGATLIQSFAEKLEGIIKIDISNGSSITVEIKDYTRIR